MEMTELLELEDLQESAIETAIRERKSIRTYSKADLTRDEKKQLVEYINHLNNPFQIKTNIRLIHTKAATKGEKLGTYGVIKGAKDFFGASIENKEMALEALGYDVEQFILFATTIGLGTCWLGGTFQRGSFAAAMNVKDNELFPIISPIGHPVEKKRPMEKLMRLAIGAEQRKPFSELFFIHDFDTPMKESEAAKFHFPLEMVRLAPSAVNHQPWRIVQKEEMFHFYQAAKKTTDHQNIDIHRIDMGIAGCHFDLAAKEVGLLGEIKVMEPEQVRTPPGMRYSFSWVFKQGRRT